MMISKTKIETIDCITSLLYDFNNTELESIYKTLWNMKQEVYDELYASNSPYVIRKNIRRKSP